MSLAHLWRDQGKVRQARELVSSGLQVVHGGLRHARFEGSEGAAGGAALVNRSSFQAPANTVDVELPEGGTCNEECLLGRSNDRQRPRGWVGFCWSQYDPGVNDTEIKIGNTMPYSGPASAWGMVGKSEAAYFAMINDQGGPQRS
jgi:hypothetical protein